MSKKNLILELSFADYITILAILLITNAIWLVFNAKIELAIAIAFFSMYLDYWDGWVARRYGASKYGRVLDSLFDILGWVLFPCLTINVQTSWAWWSLVVTSLFIGASVIRLSRFTVEGYVTKIDKYYVGLPVLYSKYALLICFFAGGKLSILILLVMIPLMITSRLIKKPSRLSTHFEFGYSLFFLYLFIYGK